MRWTGSAPKLKAQFIKSLAGVGRIETKEYAGSIKIVKNNRGNTKPFQQGAEGSGPAEYASGEHSQLLVPERLRPCTEKRGGLFDVIERDARGGRPGIRDDT
jgi:hypothetical protein